MSALKIKIPFSPKAKSSIRLGLGRFYNPNARGMKKVHDYVKLKLRKEKLPLFSGPLLVIMHFRIPVAVSHPLQKRRALEAHMHTKVPDGDNLEKFLNDALTGVVWDNDSKIAWLLRSKTYSSEKAGETILFVRELPEGVPDYEQLIADITDNINFSEV